MRPLEVVFVDEPFLPPNFLDAAKHINGVNCVLFSEGPTDTHQIVSRARTADVAIVDVVTQYTSDILSQLPKLKSIITTSVATDHIDTQYCDSRGINVISFPGFNARTVAETVILYTLALTRHLAHAWQSVLGGGWNTFHFTGFELGGKTLGVIGAGDVGTQVIHIAQGLSMNVLCHTQRPSAARARSLNLDGFVDLTDLLSASDVVVLCVPHTPHTTSMLGAHELATMKPTAYLINVGRWQLVDVQALADAVYERHIAGAALDFVAPEPYNVLHDDLRIQELVNSPNVLLLPHLAFNTHESNIRLGERLLDELTRLVSVTVSD